MKLYELSGDFRTLFDRYDEINDMEFAVNENGEPVDDNGNVIEDPVQMKRDLLEAWFTTCSALEDEFGAKAENMAVYIKESKAAVEAMKEERKALSARIASAEKRVQNITDYLMRCMDDMGLTKLDTAKAKLSVRNNAESVAIACEGDFIRWAQEHDMDDLLRYSMPEISKTAVKSALKNGTELPFAELTRTRSLIIK